MKLLYKDGKKQALTFSFDDNQDYDIKLISIFDKYGMKGTFNINSGILGIKPEDNPDHNVYINPEEVKEVYKNH
ncbi:MAG: hypothetical protein II717_06485 [Lachnospiraceae bacterium]|nr:hypothetical protein [Lachnospiraceae bacterium]